MIAASKDVDCGAECASTGAAASLNQVRILTWFQIIFQIVTIDRFFWLLKTHLDSADHKDFLFHQRDQASLLTNRIATDTALTCFLQPIALIDKICLQDVPQDRAITEVKDLSLSYLYWAF